MGVSADGFYNEIAEGLIEDARRDAEKVARYTTYVERPSWQQRFGWLVKKWRTPKEVVDWDAYDAEPIQLLFLDEDYPTGDPTTWN